VNSAVPGPDAVGCYAGPFSRLAAYAFDTIVVATVFSATSAVVLWLIQLVTARSTEGFEIGATTSAILFLAWFLVYFGVSWIAAGRTIGMALFGLRVVCRDGSHLGPGRAAVRALTFPLSFVPFGLGFTGIVVGRERRAFHDVCARTTVVYDWDARSARLRTLAHHA
jgi:uncharacterized RDD family membrane protein YckC